MSEKVNKFLLTGKVIWLYTKYQIITKGILLTIIFPLFSIIIRQLLKSTGRVSISSGDYIRFLFSFQGFIMLIITAILLGLLIGIDINAFIIMSASIKEKRINMTVKNILIVGIRSVKSLVSFSGLFIMPYVTLVIPIVGIGFTVSSMRDFQIPNFITNVIFNNSFFTFIYFTLICFLTVISIRYIFLFHYMVLLKSSVKEGLKKSSSLMKRYWKSFFKDFIFRVILIGIVLTALLIILTFTFIFSADIFTKTVVQRRVWTVFGMLLISEVITFLTFMTIPLISLKLTELFYNYNEKDGNLIKMSIDVKTDKLNISSSSKIKFSTKFVMAMFLSILMIINFVLSTISGVYFDDIFRRTKNIEIIAHRAGGNLGAENTVAGLQVVIKENIKWSEIDVQRTKDGRYIINHDSTFYRIAGDSRKSTKMTLEEIRKLKVKDSFDTNRPLQAIATIEEFLDEAKGKIGLFIELKGKSADEKMADDIIKLVKERSMEKEVAILSFDYGLIQYIEDKYPEMDTGFLYFFSIGETAKMKGDLLIMEEREATSKKIDEIQSAGKKAIVWTVNTVESIDKFVNSNVDGIITDYVLDVKAGMKRRDERSDIQIIFDNFLK